jgi:hypothetical protein
LRLIDLALRHRVTGEKIVEPVEHAFGKGELRSAFLVTLGRRDEIGLRLHHFRAVDFEQRIAALDVVAEFANHASDSAGERRQHDGAGILVEGDLTDCRLLQTKRIRHHLHDAQLMHLVGGHPNGVSAILRPNRGGLRRREIPTADL